MLDLSGRFKVFKELTKSEKEWLKDNVSYVNYNKKETILKQRTHSSNVVVLVSGLAKLKIEGENGKEFVCRIVKPQDIVGISAMFEVVYNFSVVALNACRVALISRDNFLKICKGNTKFFADIVKLQNEFTAFLLSRMGSIATKQMHGRLADVILYLTSDEFKNIDVFGNLTRKEIAEMSGMSTENAIRLLKELKNDELVKIDGKKISINNKTLLEKLSRIG